MYKSLSACGLILLAVFGLSPDTKPQFASRLPGIKMTERDTFANVSSEHTTYVQHDRKRVDFRSSSGGTIGVRHGPPIAMITRCDLGKICEMNLDTHEYSSAPYPLKPLTKEQMKARGIKLPLASELSRKPTLLIETTTVDTGERKKFFGHTARHVIVTRKETPLEDSQQDPQESVADGWYIDLDLQISCDRKSRPGEHAYLHAASSVSGRPPDLPKFVDVGQPETGFPVEIKRTMRAMYALADGRKKEETSMYQTNIAQLEEGPLDPGLFEIPAGFRQVAHIETNPPMDWLTALTMDWQWLKWRVRRVFN